MVATVPSIKMSAMGSVTKIIGLPSEICIDWMKDLSASGPRM